VIELNFTVLIQFLNFVLLLFLLNRLLYRPILRRMDERMAKIREDLDAGSSDREAARRLLSGYEAAIAKAKREGVDALFEAQREAGEETRRMVERHREEAALLIEEARRQIEEQGALADEALTREVRGLAALITRQLSGRTIHV
jgi:F-type H+-transporting ATPase subunit b